MNAALVTNIDAEQEFLGAVLTDNRILDDCEFIRPEHFASPVHGKIFEAAREMVNRGHVASAITLARECDIPELEGVGGRSYLGKLAAALTTPLVARDFAREIVDCADKRELAFIAHELIEATQRGATEPASKLIEETEARLSELAEKGPSGNTMHQFRSFARQAMESAERARKAGGLVGITTGLVDLDQITGGLHRTDLVILAGRPGMGKSALGADIAEAAALAGIPTAFFSLEMSGEQLALRRLGAMAGVSSERIRQGRITADEMAALTAAENELLNVPVFIDETGAIPLAALRSRARRLKRRYGIGLIVVDYLQLITPSGKRRNGNRVEDVSEISAGLKSIAKELNVCVLALSQLSRQVEGRDDKRPQLSDLRESGSIEQDADVVMFLFRQAYYDLRKKPNEAVKRVDWEADYRQIAHLAELHIAKQRHGRVDKIDLHFNAELTRFSNLARRV